MTTEIPHRELLDRQVTEHPYPLLFATISGAHLYGFPSRDSDFDLRGAHRLPLQDVIGLREGHETVDQSGIVDGVEIDLVTHDVKKFFGLMLKKNGYVLEQVMSPLVVHQTEEFAELQNIAAHCVTRYHSYHYLGFAETQWKLFCKEQPPRVKPLLYIYRVLLTGIHLMRSGRVESNLRVLNEEAKLPYIDNLIDRKINGAEKETLANADMMFHEGEFHRLVAELKSASESSELPETSSAKPALHDLLVRLRLKGYASDVGC